MAFLLGFLQRPAKSELLSVRVGLRLSQRLTTAQKPAKSTLQLMKNTAKRLLVAEAFNFLVSLPRVALFHRQVVYYVRCQAKLAK